MRDRAKLLASCNFLGLPSTEGLLHEALERLLQKMHELQMLFSDTDSLKVEWTAAWTTIYEVAYALATLRSAIGEVDQSPASFYYNPLRVFLLAASIQFWATIRKFTPFAGAHDYLLGQLSLELSNLDPTVILDVWQAAGGSAITLLWSLANIFGAYLRKALTMPDAMPSWLRNAMNHVVKTSNITTFEQLDTALRSMPFAEIFQAGLAEPMFIWLRDNTRFHQIVEEPKDPFTLSKISVFAYLRVGFDTDFTISWLTPVEKTPAGHDRKLSIQYPTDKHPFFTIPIRWDVHAGEKAVQKEYIEGMQ